MMWAVIISLLVFGLALLVLEVIFIPGVTVVGILGIIFSVIGISLTYENFGSGVGTYILVATSLLTGITLFISFKSGLWKKFALKNSIKSKVNEGLTRELSIGDVGLTVSTLRPVGKAAFNDRIFEVRTLGNYIREKQKVKIISVDSSQVVVEIF